MGFIPVIIAKINAFLLLLLPTLLACLACNIFITGLNQIVDVELDKINKPNLPLASGELSMFKGKTIVVFSGIIAIALSWTIQPFFGMIITSIAIIGALYSLPPVQFKKYHIWAASAIAIVRGPLINAGIAIHFSTMLYGWPVIWMGWLLPVILFVTAFSLGIAWFKDIPDTEGDEHFGHKTLALVWSKERAFRVGRNLVGSAYLFMACYWLFLESLINKWRIKHFPTTNINSENISSMLNPNYFAGFIHIILFAIFYWQSKKCDTKHQKSIKKFYMFYWGLFFLEYLILPILLI